MIVEPPATPRGPGGAQGQAEPGAASVAAERGWLTGLGPAVLLTLLALFLVAVLSVAPLFPRNVTPASAPPDAFSAERALPHLQAIAQRPHPVGSPENARVRDYLLQQLAALGLEPQVQRAVVLNPRNGEGAAVENVLVRLPGTASTRAVLLIAHYDSVVSGPGTGDDGMAVAAMVETLRALRAGPRPRNDLIFLFDDGEEAGMFGALAFVQEHPWARDVGVVFDFDADGPLGPPTLLWTTPGDGWLVDEIARAGSGILATAVDNPEKRRDFSNDLHVFAAAGYTGAHFDRVGGSTFYHTRRDSLANLDLPALQQQGDAMLALARHFGNLPIGATTADDAVFFTVFGSPILRYPAGWILPLALLGALAIAGAVGLGLRRRRLTPRGLAGALLALVIGALAAALTGHLLWQAILAAHPESRLFAERDFYGQGLYVGGLYALMAALVLALWPWLVRRVGGENLVAAGVAALGIAALILGIAEPLASYLAAWPALFGALGLAYLVAAPARGGRIWAWARLAVGLVAAAPAIGLLGAALGQSAIDGVGDSPALWFAVLVLLFGALAPEVDLVTRVARRLLPAGVALLGVGLLVVGQVTSGYNAAQPRPDNLLYILNADTGEASWVSPDAELDAWTGQLLAGGTRRTRDELFGAGGSDMLLASGAPVAPLPPPVLKLIGGEAAGDVLTLRLHLTSPRGAWRAYVIPQSGLQLVAAGLGGKPPRDVASGALRLSGLPAAGIDLTLRVRAAGPVRFTLIDQSTGLPDIPGVALPSPPETVMPAPNPEDVRGYPTAVRTSVTLEAMK